MTILIIDDDAEGAEALTLLPLLRKPVHPETLCATVALHGATWDVL